MDQNFKDKFNSLIFNSVNLTKDQDISSIKFRHDMNSSDTIIQVKKNLKADIKSKLKEVGELSLTILNNYLIELTYRHLIFGESLERDFHILCFIKAYTNLNNFFPDLNNDHYWNELLVKITDYMELSKENWSDLAFYPKILKEAEAAKFWLNRGYQLKINGNKFEVEKVTLNEMNLYIENEIKKVGGVNIIEWMLHNGRYSVELNRFLILKNNDDFQLPVGYILNLSVKYLSKVNYSIKTIEKKKIEVFLQLTKMYAAIYQLQDYNMYGHILADERSIIEYIFKNVLADKIFGIRQFNPKYIIKVLNGQLGNLYKINNLDLKLNLEFEDVIYFISAILKITDKNLLIKVSKEKLYSILKPLTTEKVNLLLEIFSIANDKINKAFTSPLDLTDLEHYPFIKKGNYYFILHSSISCLGFFECLSAEMRTNITDFDSKLGEELEIFIKSELASKGIAYSSGYYNINEECDVIVESEESIILFEIKKKALTRKAKSGDDLQLMIDISKSLFESQMQLSLRELELHENGKIKLYSKRGKIDKHNKLLKVLELNNREIEKISLNAWDYGVINDRVFANNVLTYLTGQQLSHPIAEETRDFKKINSNLSILYKRFERMSEIMGVEGYDLRNYYFNCSFMSLQMFLLCLEDAWNEEDFLRNINKVKFVSYSTGEPYFEYIESKRLRG